MNTENNIIIEKYVNSRLNVFFYILIILFWLAQIWATTDAYAISLAEHTKQNIIQTIFEKNLILKLTTFEIIVISLSIYILITFRHHYTFEKFYIIFFLLSIIVVFISLINPNNNFELRHYFGNYIVKKLYIYLLFLYTLTFLKKEIFTILIKKIFYYGSIIALLKAVQALIFFFAGMGMKFDNQTVSISYSDTLIWMAVFHCLSLSLFFNYKKKKYLYVSFIFLLALILSYRRFALILTFVVDLILFIYIIRIQNRKIVNKLIRYVFFSFIIIAVAVNFLIDKETLSDYSNRYLGAFSYFIDSDKFSSLEYSDTGHMEQSITTTSTMLKNLTFWGRGLDSSEAYYIEGQTAAIHNSFVLIWVDFGLYMLIFLIIIIFILLIKLTKLWLYIKKPYMNNLIIKVTPLLFLVVFLIAGWFAMPSHIFSFTNSLTQFVLLFSVLKADNELLSLSSRKHQYN